MFSDLRLWFCNFIIGNIPFYFIRKIFYTHVMGFKIGKGSSIHLKCVFNSTGNLQIGVNTTINQFCRIDNRGLIVIGNNVSISPYTKILTADHDINTPECVGRTKNITIGDYVFIGSEAMILGGVEMQAGSVLGAKSLLTKSTIPFGIYMGVPATYKQTRNSSMQYNASYIRWFH